MDQEEKNKVFVDTNFLVALKDTEDATHKKAKEIAKSIRSRNLGFYVALNIIIESVTIISQTLGKEEGDEILKELKSNKYTNLKTTSEIEENADIIFLSSKSKNLPYADCLTFALMKKHKIKQALSFDSHFKQYGFKRVGID